MNLNENFSQQEISNMLIELKVPYNDFKVLTTPSRELDIVNYYFDSVTCHNKEMETLLYEVIFYSLIKTAKLAKGFIFKGKGRNGKSVIFRIIESLAGEEHCSHEHLEQLSGSKAGGKSTIKALKGCTVNIAEDQKQPRYVNTSLITRIISGDTISIEQKGNEKVDFVPYATMLFSVNEVIDFKETGLYITNRFYIIPFDATFTDENNNRNINMSEELCQPLALQIIATRAIEAFKEVLKRGKFTIPPIVEEETKKYFMECNNVAEFCSIFPIETIIPKSEYYKEYCRWCKANNKEDISNVQFGKEVLALGYRAERYSFSKKRRTYYVAPDFDNSESRNIYDKYLVTSGMSEERETTTEDEHLMAVSYTNFGDYLRKNIFEEKENKI